MLFRYEDPQDIIAKDPKKTLAAPSRVSTSENAQRQSVRRQSAQVLGFFRLLLDWRHKVKVLLMH